MKYTNFEEMMEAMRADAHAVNKRLSKVLRPTDVSGTALSVQPRGANGKPACTNCGGPVEKTKYGYRKTCSDACRNERRKKGQRKPYRVTKTAAEKGA